MARVEVSWEAIHRGAGQLLAGKAVSLDPAGEIVVPGAIEIEFAAVLGLIDLKQREAIVKFFERHDDLGKLAIARKPA